MGGTLQGIENFSKKYTYLELKSLEWKIPVMNQTFLIVVVMRRIFMLRVYRESKPGGRLGQARSCETLTQASEQG